MVNYGFVLRKNVYERFFVKVWYPEVPCPESAKDEYGCIFAIYPGDVQHDLSEYISVGTDENEIQVAIAYRGLIQNEIFHSKIPSLRYSKR